MNQGRRMPKLLSPINSFEGAVRVIEAGANEIYCGVTNPKSKNFWLHRGPDTEIATYDELGQVVGYAHDYGVEVLVTVNEPFMAEVIEKAVKSHVHSCLDMGVDALIVGGVGVLSIVKEIDANIPLYASTYFSSTNYEAVNFLKRLGFSRVVLERHLTVPEITEIVQHSEIDVEVFIHGPGCSNVDGRCYLYHFDNPKLNLARAKLTGLRNPCNLPFEIYDVDDKGMSIGNVPIMDAFTSCSLCRLPELIRAGVAGLKIADRCECIAYQEGTTRAYRELIDMIGRGETAAFQERLEELRKTFTVAPPMLGNLQEFCCEQGRCYFSNLFHVPYKIPLSWRAWTKLQFAIPSVKEE